MKTFFKTIGAAFHSSELYKKAKGEGASQGIKFIVKLSVFFGLIFGVICLIVFLSFSASLKRIGVNFVDKSYPSELTVTIKDGVLTSNAAEPVYVPLPFTAKDGKKLPKNLAVLVPNEKAEAGVLAKYDTISAATADGIVSQNGANPGDVQIRSYGKANKVLTKDLVLSGAIRLLRILATVIAIAAIPMFIFLFLFMSFWNMVLLFLTALFIQLIMRLRKLPTSYAESYRMGLYALAPLLILQIAAFPFPFKGPLFAIIIVLAVILLATRKWHEEVETSNTPEDPA